MCYFGCVSESEAVAKMSAEDHFHHVRDFGYFEVPKFVPPTHRYAEGEVPWHVKEILHLDNPTAEQVNAELVGKILIPQPFAGTAKHPGFLITKFMVLQVVVLVLCLLIFRGLATRIRSGQPARGRFWNFWEMIALVIRDQVVRPTIGDHSHDHADHGHGEHGHNDSGHHGSHSPVATGSHAADRYLPFVWSCFFYILLCNLLGAVPSLGSATGNINVTVALAMTAMLASFLFGVQVMGVSGFFGNLIPNTGMTGGGGIALACLMFPIEGLGFIIKHAILALRLFGNIMGGHTALGVMLGFIATAAKGGVALWGVVTVGSILGQIGVGILELLVAVLQAYVFSFLATIFISGAVHKH